jgi:hypothetical protein
MKLVMVFVVVIVMAIKPYYIQSPIEKKANEVYRGYCYVAATCGGGASVVADQDNDDDDRNGDNAVEGDDDD